jgi:hypothetical protein
MFHLFPIYVPCPQDFRLVPLRQWLLRLSAPFFAAPLPFAASCLVLSVDGVLRCLDAGGGRTWSLALEGNAFGTPCRWGEQVGDFWEKS